MLRAGRPLPDGLSRQLVTFSTDERFPGLAALCWRCRGMLADDAEIDDCFAAAVALHERTGQPVRAGPDLALPRRAAAPGRSSGEARDRLTAAADLFDRIGARQWVLRADAELRAAGAGAGPTGPRPAGVDALTAQELQVALAVARDLSNKQVAAELYLSPKTVEFHLGNVYRKLGIRSRAGLAARLSDLQPAGVPQPG